MSDPSPETLDLDALEKIQQEATPGPWINANPRMGCTTPGHSVPHPGPPECVYGFLGWNDNEEDWGRYVSSAATKQEIVGANDYGPILTKADARYIAAFDPPTTALLLREIRELREKVRNLEHPTGLEWSMEQHD